MNLLKKSTEEKPEWVARSDGRGWSLRNAGLYHAMITQSGRYFYSITARDPIKLRMVVIEGRESSLDEAKKEVANKLADFCEKCWHKVDDEIARLKATQVQLGKDINTFMGLMQ